MQIDGYIIPWYLRVCGHVEPFGNGIPRFIVRVRYRFPRWLWRRLFSGLSWVDYLFKKLWTGIVGYNWGF